MTFHEVRLPTDVERNASGGPGFLTSVSILQSGKEQRNSLWEVDRGNWDIGYGIQTREQALAVRDFFFARRGRLYGFRFRDWSNYRTEGTAKAPAGVASGLTGEPAEADGISNVFQLYYTYTDSGAFGYTKKIFKPVASTVKIYIEGALISPTEYGLNATNGKITFDDPPEYNSRVEWTGEFDLPVRFDIDRLEMVVTTAQVISQPSIQIIELKL